MAMFYGPFTPPRDRAWVGWRIESANWPVKNHMKIPEEGYFLPPYAPDLNPDEFVWAHMKTNGLSKKPLRKNESLKERVAGDLAVIKGNRQLVRSFFGAASVAYTTD
jgi:transposase